MIRDPYDYQEKEVYRQLFKKLSQEHASYGKNMNSEVFTQRIFHNIEIAVKYLRDLDKQKVIGVLRGLMLDKRGKEECDCGKNLGKCGCSVKDFNEAVEENNFAIALAINSITKL